jgi:hypothetical protein
MVGPQRRDPGVANLLEERDRQEFRRLSRSQGRKTR